MRTAYHKSFISPLPTTGYTAGYAQGYFDELVYRGEIWRSTLTDLQGRLILEKEKFAYAKDEIDRDLTIQVSCVLCCVVCRMPTLSVVDTYSFPTVLI